MAAPIDPATRTSRVKNRWWYVLLLPPYVGTLWLPFYAKKEPRLFGFPFFYWWQFLWVIFGVALTAIVYVLTTQSDAPNSGRAGPVSPGRQRPSAGRDGSVAADR